MISWGETGGIPEDGEAVGSFVEITCNAAGITPSLSRDTSASSAAGRSRGVSFFASFSAPPEGGEAEVGASSRASGESRFQFPLSSGLAILEVQEYFPQFALD